MTELKLLPKKLICEEIGPGIYVNTRTHMHNEYEKYVKLIGEVGDESLTQYIMQESDLFNVKGCD